MIILHDRVSPSDVPGVFYSFASSSKEVSLQIDEAISSWRALQNKMFH